MSLEFEAVIELKHIASQLKWTLRTNHYVYNMERSQINLHQFSSENQSLCSQHEG